MSESSKRIAALNDAFRKLLDNPSLGRTYTTDGVRSLGLDFTARAILEVVGFDKFTADNDPYGEHDFGSFELEGEKLFWKIDYYSKADPDYGSEDPSDPQKTTRVLTIMLAEEY